MKTTEHQRKLLEIAFLICDFREKDYDEPHLQELLEKLTAVLSPPKP